MGKRRELTALPSMLITEEGDPIPLASFTEEERGQLEQRLNRELEQQRRDILLQERARVKNISRGSPAVRMEN